MDEMVSCSGRGLACRLWWAARSCPGDEEEPLFSPGVYDYSRGHEARGRFFHGLLSPVSGNPGGRSHTTNWVEVSEAIYRKYKPFLGMALIAKSDTGVNDTPHPAGYHYVGNPQYGSWNHGSGGNFWVFYGQYALMRDMMGYGGRSTYRNDYNDYQNHRDRRQPYYGRNKEWGTGGSVTKQQKTTFFQRRKQRLANKRNSFSQKVRNRSGRSRSGFGSRSRGRFGK